MGETGFKCPKCGFEGSFTASAVTLFTETRITPDGWDYMFSDCYGTELPAGTQMTCGECDYTSDWKEFEEEAC